MGVDEKWKMQNAFIRCLSYILINKYEPVRGVPVSRNLRVRPVIWGQKTGLPGAP